MSLTERKIKYLEAGKSRQIAWDNGGFGMQVAPNGEKSFIMEYRFNEMTKFITLGIYPAMSLETAKKQAVKAFGMIVNGVDPEEAGLPEPGVSTASGAANQKQTLDQFKDLASETLDQIKTSETLSKVKDMASETLGQIKTSETLSKVKGIASQKLDQIRKRVEKKVKQAQGKPQPAENKIIPLEKKAKPPVQPAPPPAQKKAKPPSIKDQFDRLLDKSELKTLWSGLQNSDMPPQNQLAVKLLMATAQKPVDVVSSKGADFDLVSKWWEIQGSQTSTGKKHKVPLTNLALDIVRKIKELSGMSGVLFPVPGGVTAIEPKVLEDDLRRAQLRFGLKAFTLEDLHNSMVCQMLDNGISEPILYQLLNQDLPAGAPLAAKKVTDRDLRDALDKLEKQLPKAF